MLGLTECVEQIWVGTIQARVVLGGEPMCIAVPLKEFLKLGVEMWRYGDGERYFKTSGGVS